jgi:predicted small secreted protein
MKNVLKAFGIIAIVAVIGFSMAACSNDDGGGGSDGSQYFFGTWKGDGLTVTCEYTIWSAVYPGQGSWSGTYKTTNNGKTANFTETNGNNFGTANVSGNTMTVASTYGTFTLTKISDDTY